jgi:ABC-type multidrug transport system fused ATPase/permease subunit
MLAMAAGLVLAAVVRGGLRMRELLDAELLAQDYVVEVRMALYEHLSALSARALQARSRGGVMLRFVGDLTALRQWVGLGVARSTVAGVTAVLALSALALISWPLALAASAALVVSLLAAFTLGERLRAAVRESRRRNARIAANVNDKIASMQVVQLFNQSQRERTRIARQNERLKQAMVDRARVRGWLRGVLEASGAIATAAVLMLGATLVTAGAASAGTVVAAMAIVGLLIPSLRDLGRVYEYWHGARVSREKIAEFLETPAGIVAAANLPSLQPGPGRLEFDSVTVMGALQDFTAVAPAGSVVAVVGPNGSGKSVLLSLVARLIEADSGRILIDGQDIASIGLSSLRRAVSMVGPDLSLLRGRLDKNLLYRSPNAEQKEIERVFALCGIDALLRELPAGATTRIAEGGVNLSPGQRARIALARALLGSPMLLLLDEADTNLDPQAAEVLDRTLASFSGTVVLVTHRLERLRAADLVWHLQSGNLVEAGIPDEVLGHDGPTARLFRCPATVSMHART